MSYNQGAVTLLGETPTGTTTPTTTSTTTPTTTSTATPTPTETLPPPTGTVFPPGRLLVINEFDYDQGFTDAGEFIELKNTSSVSRDLSDFHLVLVDGANGNVVYYETILLPAVMLPAGEYYVICTDSAITPNCDLDVIPDLDLIQDGAPDAVSLWITLPSGSLSMLDTVSYEGNTSFYHTEGSGVGLEDDPTHIGAGIARIPDGNDTNSNNVDFIHTCISPGLQNVAIDPTFCGGPTPTATTSVTPGTITPSPTVTAITLTPSPTATTEPMTPTPTLVPTDVELSTFVGNSSGSVLLVSVFVVFVCLVGAVRLYRQ